MGSDRLESFSDGVLAVIITLMAFELKAPASVAWSSVSHLLPLLLVYVLSFTFVGIYWVNHHHLLRATEHISAAVMWTNLQLLFWLSLIPFATAWVGAHHGQALPAATYGVVGLGAGVAYTTLGRAILRANPNDTALARVVGRDIKGPASMVLYIVSIPLAYVSPYFSYCVFVVIAVIWFLPDRRLVKETGST
jgi:uncharacterized membrane protein